MRESHLFALTLSRTEGVGRVTAGRLLAHFPTYDALLAYPREQVLTRLKGIPGGAAIVARLFDDEAFRAEMQASEAILKTLAERRVAVMTPRDAAWPRGLDDLPPARRPFLLYAFGNAAALEAPLAAFLAAHPLAEDGFERAQDLARFLAGHHICPATAAASGFDVVVNKIARDTPGTPAPVLVAGCGMARLQPPLRPVVSTAVRSGGLFLSPFPMEHGPFPHDEHDRALLQAALTRVSVFVTPAPDTPEWHAMRWALDAGRAVFAFANPAQPLPPRVHVLASPVDYEWVLAAVHQEAPTPRSAS